MKEEIEKQKQEIISVNIQGEMTAEEFAEKIAKIIYAPLDHDIDPAFFVALVESKFESWDTAIDLMNHYDYLKKVFKDEDPEWKKYTPKLDCPKDLLNRDWKDND